MAPPSQVTPAPLIAPTSPPQEQWEDVIAFAKSKGYDLPYQDSEQALDALLASYRQVQQLGPYAQIGQQVAPYYDKFTQFMQSQQQGQQPQEPKLWDSPEFDPSWLSQVTEDAQGNVVPRTGQSPDVAAKVQRFLAWSGQKVRDIVRDPVTTLGPVIEHIAEKKAKQLIDGQLQQLRVQSTWDQFASQNQSWLVQHDQAGNPMLDQMQGGPKFTPDGQVFVRYLGEASQLGITDPAKQIQYASRLLSAQRTAAQPTQQYTPAPQPTPPPVQPLYDARFDFLRRAAGRTDQFSASTNPGVEQNPMLDPRQALLNELQRLYPNDQAFRQAVMNDSGF